MGSTVNTPGTNGITKHRVVYDDLSTGERAYTVWSPYKNYHMLENMAIKLNKTGNFIAWIDSITNNGRTVINGFERPLKGVRYYYIATKDLKAGSVVYSGWTDDRRILESKQDIWHNIPDKTYSESIEEFEW
jgi:hypothetical protein